MIVAACKATTASRFIVRLYISRFNFDIFAEFTFLISAVYFDNGKKIRPINYPS